MFSLITFLHRAIMQGIPLLFGSTGEIMTEKSGNLNLGIPGVMYIGGMSGVIGAFLYENSLSSPSDAVGFLAVMIPLLCCALGSLLAGLIYCFLTVTLRANQNVTGLALTTFGTGFGNFFGGSLIKLVGSDVPSVALTTTSNYFRTTLPGAETTGWFGKLFLSYGFLAYAAVIIAIICSYFLNHTRHGLNLRAVGENPATADAAGINVNRAKYLSTCIGSVIAGFGGLYYVMDYANGVWSNDGFGDRWKYDRRRVDRFGDRGWLAIALVIFAIWRPNLSILGSIVFGGLYIVYLYVPGALRTQELYKMIPYVVTIVVLILVSVRDKKENQGPASLGLSYFREDR